MQYKLQITNSDDSDDLTMLDKIIQMILSKMK